MSCDRPILCLIRSVTCIVCGFRTANIELSHWYKVDKVFYTPEAKLRCVKIKSYITKRS